MAIPVAVAEKIASKQFFSAPPTGETESQIDPISRTTSPHAQYYIVLKFCVPRPQRLEGIRLFRNLKMPPYGNERHRTAAISRARIGKNTDDGVVGVNY